MRYIADLHIHSHFSRATSRLLTPEYLDYFAGLKGIRVVGTGDFTHPGWLEELREKTVPDGNGFLRLKENYTIDSHLGNNDTRFILTAEISNIYKRDGKVRKVHNLILVNDFTEAEKINRRLVNIGGNLTSDGRPILGLDSRDLLEIVLECSENNYFIPAHIWTPWFSMLGSKSGFDSPEECFADLSGHIHTIETGLSTDPPMNWLCSFLDKVTLVSNSDAHSPDKLGRNANIFNTGLDYFSMIAALRSGDQGKFLGTIDMFPQEGKYHYDGHRKCNICWNPSETLRNHFICPVCKRPVTVGVMNRIIHLSDRINISERPNRFPFRSIIPLKEILSEIAGTGVNSKKVESDYLQTLKSLGTELDILLDIPVGQIEAKASKPLAEGIRRMRNREVIIKEGYDGEYGEIKVFRPGEAALYESASSLFNIEKPGPPQKRDLINFDLQGIQELLNMSTPAENIAAGMAQDYKPVSYPDSAFEDLNPEQNAAVMNTESHSFIIAGPGTGKTKTLISKIAWLVKNGTADPQQVLAITFTNKAAGELRTRLKSILGNMSAENEISALTFHAFGLSVLKEFHYQFDRSDNFMIADEEMKRDIIKLLSNGNAAEIKKYSREISDIKTAGEEESLFFKSYEDELKRLDIFDMDDLIVKPLILLTENESVRDLYQNRFRFIFVDEFQDINESQYRLVKIVAEKSILCVVGDEDQSIYGFRGSGSEFIERFTIDYPAAKLFRLTRSYRCSQTILDASLGILNKPSGFLEGLKEGVQISVSEQPTGAAEAEFIARQIVRLTGGVSFFSIDSNVTDGNRDDLVNSLSDFAILCRTRDQFGVIAKALRDHNLPYQEVGTVPFFREEPFRKYIGILRILISVKFENTGALLKMKGKQIPGHRFREISGKAGELSLITYLEYVRDQLFDPQTFNPELWMRFKGLAESMRGVKEFLEFLTLGTGTDTHDHKMEAVSLMTLHASKGLEFECVFIAGCEDGLIPYSLYNAVADKEEERRLLYVGMTRAKRLLYLTHSGSRNFHGHRFSLPVSPFITSIQMELLRKVHNTAPKRKDRDGHQLNLFN
ncbi:MAG: UvrD-helicase domain-containing protein [Prolixibacteraceae bacterium]|nr:UvrD-helicase domain-containing protein [Prolixibacteraceae bacterium]